MKCPKCQTSLADSAAYCSSCGTFVTGLGIGSPATSDGEMPVTQADPVAPGTDPSELPTVIGPVGSTGGSLGGASIGGERAHTTLQPGWRLGERYEIVSVLGAGGMGIVYRARDLKLVRDVALKVIRPDLLENPAVAERFRREILLSSQITHKNILRVHDLGESDGLAYISMNYVEGRNASGSPQERRTVAHGQGGWRGHPALRCHGGRPRRGRHPPRPEAAEYSSRQGTRGLHRRLRDLALARGGGKR